MIQAYILFLSLVNKHFDNVLYRPHWIEFAKFLFKFLLFYQTIIKHVINKMQEELRLLLYGLLIFEDLSEIDYHFILTEDSETYLVYYGNYRAYRRTKFMCYVLVAVLDVLELELSHIVLLL